MELHLELRPESAGTLIVALEQGPELLRDESVHLLRCPSNESTWFKQVIHLRLNLSEEWIGHDSIDEIV